MRGSARALFPGIYAAAVVVGILLWSNPCSAQVPQVDTDADGIPDAQDNCDLTRNFDQADLDKDTIGDPCDNCRSVKNTNQLNFDLDHIGDACDKCPDTLADIPIGIGSARVVVSALGCSISQKCPCDGPFGKHATWRSRPRYLRCIAKKARQLVKKRMITARERFNLLAEAKLSKCGRLRTSPGDTDGDGILDDGDFDGVVRKNTCKDGAKDDCDDNCRKRRNAGQRDRDADGKGDVCDRDIDGDDVPNRLDNCPFKPNKDQLDGDDDEVGDECDDCKNSDEDADVDSKGCD